MLFTLPRMKPLLGSLTVLAILLSLPSYADEDIRPRSELLSEGFEPVQHEPPRGAPTHPYAPHSLPWPVAFADADHTMGNVMAQFQPFDDPPYFHGGIDIRVVTSAPVQAPVSGWLEAGHYSYATRPDGSMEKYWKPWPQTGNATYFEVAIVSAEGIRFELHHMNRSRLPADIVAKLNQGRTWIEAGTVLGYAVPFSYDYNHIHYNVVLPDGIRLNPEFLSPLVPDTEAPHILASRVDLQAGEIVIATYDSLGRGPYQHPPTAGQLRFETSGLQSGWDFTEALVDGLGQFPNLPGHFHIDSLTFPNGETYATEGGYGDGISLIRLPIPTGARGAYRIEVRDAAGNRTEVKGSL